MFRGFQVARRARDDFGMLIATGITTWIAVQALLNIGGITRTIPLTGVPLPFLSFGATPSPRCCSRSACSSASRASATDRGRLPADRHPRRTTARGASSEAEAGE